MTSSKGFESIYPLTPAQHGMLLEALRQQGDAVFVEQFSWTIDGAIDAAALASAFQQLVDRHAALRTAFAWKKRDVPLQVVARTVPAPVDARDARALDPAAQEREIVALIDAERLRGFDLSRAPLVRLATVRTGDAAHTLVLTFHHAVVDGWSVSIMVRELMQLYASIAEGRRAALPPAGRFEEYVAWLSRQDLAAAERFWRGALAGFTAPTPLGAPGEEHVSEIAPRYGELFVRASPYVTEGLTAAARRARVTLSTVLQAAWALQLARYSGEASIAFGATVSGRPTALSCDGVVGLFINTLPVRATIDRDAPFARLVADLQRYAAALREFEFTPGDRVRASCDVPQGLPLYESLLVFQNYRWQADGEEPSGAEGGRVQAGRGALRFGGYRSGGARTSFAVTLVTVPGAELGIKLVYDRRRLDDDAARAVASHLHVLLAGIGEAPDATAGMLMQRIALREVPVVRPAPRLAIAAAADDGEPPRTPTEVKVAEVWCELLGQPRVSRSRSFFELGGASLLALRVLERLKVTFGAAPPIHVLLKAPTVAGMAEAIDALAGSEGRDARGEGATLVPAPDQRYEPFPPTDLQRAYWLGQDEHFELGGIVASAHEVVEGAFDAARIQAALDRLIERHDMLRAIVLEDGRLQVLKSVPRYPTEVVDLRAADPARIEAGLADVHRRVAASARPLAAWPTFDVAVVLLPAGRVRVHFRAPLVVFDGMSMGIFTRELGILHEDPAAELPPLALTFRDYAIALEQIRRGAAFERAADYWRSRAPRLPPPPELPLKAAPSAVGRQSMSRRRASLPREAWSALKERAGAAGLTANAVLIAAYAAVLARWSKEPHFTLNVLLGDRPPLHPDLDQVVGNMSATLLLEVAPGAPGEPFADGAARVQTQLWQDLEHRAFSGVRTLGELNRAHARLGRAAMPIVFSSTLGLGGDAPSTVAVEIVDGSLQTPQVWIDHSVMEHRGALTLYWDVAEALFPPGMIEAMFAIYTDLLARLAADDRAWRRSPGPLVPEDQLAVRAAVNATSTPLPDVLLHEPFEAQARARPDAVAVVAPDRTLSYGELSLRADALATALNARGAGARGEVVAVVMEKGWEQVVAVLGILRAGAAYLPLDPALPRERLHGVIRDAGVRVAVTQEQLAAAVAWPDAVTRVVVGSAMPPSSIEPAATVSRSPADVAYVIYTSGSTGAPKGVVIDHRGAVNTVLDINRRFAIGPGDRVLALSALSFDLSVWDVFGVLGAGGAIVLPAPSDLRDPSRWVERIDTSRVTVWNTVPALMTILADYLDAEPARAPRSLRLALWSGDWIPVTLPARVRAHLPAIEIVSLGGATEASIWSIMQPIGEVDPSWTSIPYGRPLANQGWAVLDDAKEPRPVWVPGELHITGVGVALGYFGDEARTRERFDVDPETGARRYKTGDLGRYLPDGTIELLGRNDLQVKVQGYRVELGEIEAALLQHAGVRACAVVALGDPRGTKRLSAFVVPSTGPGDAPPVDALRAHLRAKVPEYMVPSSFTLIDALPLTSNGKVDRGALAAPSAASSRARKHVAARDAIELALVEIWEDALDRRPIGVADDFFDLGGQSVVAVRMVTQIQARLGRRLSLATLLERPTIEELATALRREPDAGPRTPLVPIRRGSGGTPLFLVHPVGGSAMCYVSLAKRLGGARPIHALQSPGLDGESAPHTTIEAMAADYLRAVRAVQPEGPYWLGGFSLGGVVAYEMARMLAAEGERTALVVMLDSAAPSHQAASRDDEEALSAQFVGDLVRSSGAPIDVAGLDLSGLDEETRLERIFELARAAELVPEDSGRERVRALYRVFSANMRALVRYVPAPYGGPVALARAEGETPRDPALGWSLAGATALEVAEFPGDHYSMWTPPRGDALVEWLTERLAE